MDNLVSGSAAPGLASRVLDDEELLLMSTEEPPTFIDDKRNQN
jgi:hypothetical protein